MNERLGKLVKGSKVRIRKQLLKWYAGHHRNLPWRDTDDPYRIWVSEVMLQQTQVKTVIPYYNAFTRRFPDIGTLSRAREQTVLKQWEGLGYYARCRNLHRAAQTVSREYCGMIPDDMETFRKLPGVGEYIGAAVQSIAFNHPYAVVDGNVKRVLARLYEIDVPVNSPAAMKSFRSIAEDLLDAKDPGTFNQAMMELGALICTPNGPDCTHCPIRRVCGAHNHQRVDEYPVRGASKSIPEHYLTAGVIVKDGKFLIIRRPSKGLLGGLWEFPGGEIHDGEPPETGCIREIKKSVNLTVNSLTCLTRVRHAYTHFKFVMDVFLCRYRSGSVKLNGAQDYRWVKTGGLKKLPFSKASLKFIPLLDAESIEQADRGQVTDDG